MGLIFFLLCMIAGVVTCCQVCARLDWTRNVRCSWRVAYRLSDAPNFHGRYFCGPNAQLYAGRGKGRKAYSLLPSSKCAGSTIGVATLEDKGQTEAPFISRERSNHSQSGCAAAICSAFVFLFCMSCAAKKHAATDAVWSIIFGTDIMTQMDSKMLHNDIYVMFCILEGLAFGVLVGLAVSAAVNLVGRMSSEERGMAKICKATFADGTVCEVIILQTCMAQLDKAYEHTLLTDAERTALKVAEENEHRRQTMRSQPASTSPSAPMCPSCHGFNTGKITAIKRVLEHSTFGWAAPSSGNTFECYDCGYKW